MMLRYAFNKCTEFCIKTHSIVLYQDAQNPNKARAYTIYCKHITIKEYMKIFINGSVSISQNSPKFAVEALSQKGTFHIYTSLKIVPAMIEIFSCFLVLFLCFDKNSLNLQMHCTIDLKFCILVWHPKVNISGSCGDNANPNYRYPHSHL